MASTHLDCQDVIVSSSRRRPRIRLEVGDWVEESECQFVREVNEAASLPFLRIVEAVDLTPIADAQTVSA